MNNLERQFQDVFALLAHPLGIVAIVLLIGLAFLAVLSARMRWIATSMLLLSTMFTLPTFSKGRIIHSTLLFPFEPLRLHTRAISSAIVLVLALAAITSPIGWRRVILPLGLVAFFAFQLCFTSLELATDPTTKRLISPILFAVTFISVGMGVNKWLQHPQDARRLLWSITWAMCILTGVICLHLVVDSTPLFHGGRLRGPTANPQFLATIAAIGFLPAMHQMVDERNSKGTKVILAALLGFLALFLFWTGSRTGVLMALVGVLAYFRLRFGRLLFAGVLVGIFAVLAVHLLADESTDALIERYAAMSDSRTQVWQRQWNVFLANPWTGALAKDDNIISGTGENSYLMVLASYGLIGFLPFLCMLIIMGRDLIATWRAGSKAPQYKRLVDLIFATFMAAAVGAFFEPFLLGQFNFIVLVLFMYSGLAAFIRDAAANQDALPLLPVDDTDAEVQAA